MRDKQGFCPGGLSVPEYERIEGMANNFMSEEAGGRVLDMLAGGRIRRVKETHHKREAEPNRVGGINVADRFFAHRDGVNEADRAWILGHEVGHMVQWELAIFYTDIGNARIRPDLARLGRFRRTRGLEENAGFRAYQADADAYACANVLVEALSDRRGHCK